MNFFRSHLFSFFEGEDEFKKRPEFKKESPDHIGLHFLFLSYLLEKTLDGKEKRLQRKLQHFIDSYLFPFCIVFLSTLEKDSKPPFKEFGQKLLRSFLKDFREDSKEEKTYPEVLTKESHLENWSATNVLENKDLGLKDVVHYLLNPSQAGFFLGQGNLLECAKVCDLPSSFGKREDILLQLFYTSLDFEKWGLFLEALYKEGKRWLHFYQKKKENLKGQCQFWNSLINRSRQSLELLSKMKTISEIGKIKKENQIGLIQKSF